MVCNNSPKRQFLWSQESFERKKYIYSFKFRVYIVFEELLHDLSIFYPLFLQYDSDIILMHNSCFKGGDRIHAFSWEQIKVQWFSCELY